MDSEGIDIRWIPLAKAAFTALGTQIGLIEQFIPRIEERVSRYAEGSFERGLQELELIRWKVLLETLKAIQNGRTVQPS